MFILDCNGIPPEITNTIGAVYNILLVVVPIIIVIFGIIDFVKAVMSGKEDEIKKNTSTFIKRLITGLLVFFVLALVKLILNIIQTNNQSEAIACINSIFGNSSESEDNQKDNQIEDNQIEE